MSERCPRVIRSHKGSLRIQPSLIRSRYYVRKAKICLRVSHVVAGANVERRLYSFTFTFTTIQARPLYEAYVLGSVCVLTRCYCSVFNVHTPVLKALRFGAVTREAGKAFDCSRVLGKKLYLRYVSSLEELEMS